MIINYNVNDSVDNDNCNKDKILSYNGNENYNYHCNNNFNNNCYDNNNYSINSK